MSDGTKFFIAIAAGIPLAFVGLVFGLIAMGATLLACVVGGILAGRAVFAGMASAIGVTWSLLLVIAEQSCDQPGQPCGATPPDLLPLIAVSVCVAAVGGAAALITVRGHRTEDPL